MKFSNFLFPHAATPEDDFDAVTQALEEAALSDELGFDAIWLGEHHIDGACAYVDPLTFAGAVVSRTKTAMIGFAAVQMALHHPIRLAEQVSLLDNLSEGRIILGVGRGTAFNFYEYRSYGIPFADAQARLLESEEIIIKAWTTENYRHNGEHFNIDLPVLRPQVYTKPHPPMIRAVATESSMIQMGKQGRPFMLVVQPDDETARRFETYKKTMAKSGFDENKIQSNMEQCWIWRNVFVADTDSEAESVGVPAFLESRRHIEETRRKLNTAKEMNSVARGLADPRFGVEHSLIYGSPDTVSERLAKLEKLGMGGVILHFRVGTIPKEANDHSLKLFADRVMPNFNQKSASK